jgi:hypothetical protein
MKEQSTKQSIFLDLVKHRGDPSIKDCIGKYYFHFHPEEKDLETEFQTIGLRKSWGKSYSFYDLVDKEMEKYLGSAGEDYDVIGVLLALRIRIEQIAHQRLPEVNKTQFIETHKTRAKLEYCESECGLGIPEIHYLLSIIYNDNLHWREGRNYEMPLRSKLSNPTIKKMIKTIAESEAK